MAQFCFTSVLFLKKQSRYYSLYLYLPGHLFLCQYKQQHRYAREFFDCTDEGYLMVHTSGGFNPFTNIYSPLNLIALEEHYNYDSMVTILSLEDVSSLPDVRLTMDSSK